MWADYNVHHKTLQVIFNKLTRRGVPGYIVNRATGMPSKLCESDEEIAFLVRFVFQMGCAKEVSYRPTSLICICTH